MVRLIILFLVIFSTCFQVLADDCLWFAKKNISSTGEDIVWFYRITEALYTQQRTSGSDDETPLYDLPIPKKYEGLLTQFFTEEEFFDQLEKRFSDYRYLIKQYSLSNVDIQKIHDGAIYGDTPVFCKDFSIRNLLSINEIIKKIHNEDFLTELRKDSRFLRVEKFRNEFPSVDTKIKIGGEIELFNPDYIALFDKFVDWKQEALKNKDHYFPKIGMKEKYTDLSEHLIAALEKNVTDTKITPENYSIDLLMMEFWQNFNIALSNKLKWVILAFNLKVYSMDHKAKHPNAKTYEHFASQYFAFSPMMFANVKITDDESLSYQVLGSEINKVELVHARPYKDMSAYLENLLLLTHNKSSLQKAILEPSKLLNNDYTHHLHISYKNADLMKIGSLYQDRVALSMLTSSHDENAFNTTNYYIVYRPNPEPDARGLMRIAVEYDKSRIEFRRQIADLSYEAFLAEIYHVLNLDPVNAEAFLKKRNLLFFTPLCQ